MTALSLAIPAHEEERHAAVVIRPLGRGDGDLLDRIMDGMSLQSRYQRFHSPKPSLNEADRAFLTNVDGHDHLALVAFAADGAPVGVARAVRLRDEPAAAEIAVAVVDASQRHGVGSELIGRLARCAAAAGIERFIAHVLSESGLSAHLTRRGWRMTAREGNTVTLGVDAWRVAAR
jgi:GNAT superfamily N-acetyltransferase